MFYAIIKHQMPTHMQNSTAGSDRALKISHGMAGCVEGAAVRSLFEIRAARGRLLDQSFKISPIARALVSISEEQSRRR